MLLGIVLRHFAILSGDLTTWQESRKVGQVEAGARGAAIKCAEEPRKGRNTRKRRLFRRVQMLEKCCRTARNCKKLQKKRDRLIGFESGGARYMSF
jgi:hypothetical protein